MLTTNYIPDGKQIADGGKAHEVAALLPVCSELHKTRKGTLEKASEGTPHSTKRKSPNPKQIEADPNQDNSIAKRFRVIR